jgi:hypothetical protein
MTVPGTAPANPRLFRRPTGVDVGITLLAITILVVNAAHHEMWRDEMNAFEIALHSASLSALFQNLHYEGHPPIWYLILWVASKFSAAPETAVIIHTGIVILIYMMIGLFSPFSVLEKLLLLSGYFLGFEYAVIARNYSLGILFALLYAELRTKRPDRVVLNSTFLGLLANTTVFGLIMSGVFACEYVVGCMQRTREFGTPRLSVIAKGAAVYLGLIGLAVFTMSPAQDIGAHGSTSLFHYASDFWHLKLAIVNTISLPFIPLHGDFPAAYWIGLEPAMRSLWTVGRIGVFLVVLALVLIFRRDTRLLLVIAGTGVAIVLFGHLVYMAGIRHTGIFFVVVLTALWMQRVVRPRGSWVVPALLLCGSIAGIESDIGQWMRPFSNSRIAAQYLSDHGWRDAGLIGVQDDLTMPVVQHLGRPLYVLECECEQSFVKFDRRHDDYRDEQLAERLVQAVSRIEKQPQILIYSVPKRTLDQSALESVGLRAISLADFRGSETGEDYQIYRIESAR